MDTIDAKPVCFNGHDYDQANCPVCFQEMLSRLSAERDAARAQLHRLEEENGRLRGQLTLEESARAEAERNAAELRQDRYRAQKGFEREHDIRLATEKALVAAGNATAKVVEERDRARRQLAEKQRQVEDWEDECHNARHDRDTARGALKTALADYDSACAERDAARAAADDWATTVREYARVVTCAARLLGMKDPDNADPGAMIALLRAWRSLTPPFDVAEPAGERCPLIKSKPVSVACYVLRRCRLADGHDGQCEPA